ncbi:MBL fold metallo-hydrolase [Rubellimicrobium sp. CFH 75288]|uniref:MBL fold metallo-hydrolase n=1 Tax=Rubellimicrobium sp. CFH 75288 TaxID=2697034 RepID=UPI0014124ABD|nr:MBL fold metallo-hydrolase [Rubellimicrobium sp. CFH 75288]NAZ36588.1 MBL fold metallo-hydrolase [Rubellimicrobium sp. CFH 75288]
MILPPGWEPALGPHTRSPHPLDASCWRLTTARGRTILVDAGAGLGPPPPVPDLLLVTHGHADHAAGAARLAARGARVLAGERTAAWLRAGDEAAVSLDRARAAGLYPPECRLLPCPAEGVAPGVPVPFDDATLEAIPTPGHSADHTAWLVTAGGLRVLAGGDAIFAGGTVILQDIWDCSVPDTCATIRRLAALAPDAILPGHGPPLPGAAAREALAAALDRVDRFLPPALFL